MKKDNCNITVDDEILSAGNEDSLSVTDQETNQYLNDIKVSTSDEFYKFVDYLIKQKGFKFNIKSSNDGYSIYSNSKYSCKLYDGENYVLPAGTQYFISKNRMSYVLDEYYPDMLYSQDDNTYVDELYLGWLKWVENYHFKLNIEEGDAFYVNSDNGMFDRMNIVINGATTINTNPITTPIGNLPKVYDLRNVNGQNYVTSVKDQANASTCWIFSTIAALESHLLKTESKTYDFSTEYDFSENNLKNVMSSIGRQGINRTVIGGGDSNFALSYLLRWSGPILEKFDKYELDGLNPVNNIPIEFNNSAKHIQGVKYIHKRDNATDNNEIKRAIMDYGGVVTSMWWIRDLNKYEIGDNYYYDGNANEKDNKGNYINYGHSICIVGWDDNYNKTNFKKTPKDNGAFIIKNSWGNDVGNEGYYYVSYYDTQLAMRTELEINNCVGFAFTLVENNTNYGKNYNYNPLGVTVWDNNTGTNSYYSCWVADDDEILKACGVYVNDTCNCTIEVFINNIINNSATTVVPLFYGGFHTITFKSPINVKKGQNFMIVVTINSNSQISIPLEYNYDVYFTVVNSHKSGLIYKNGYSYTPVIYNNADVCMNVFTEYKKRLDTKIDVITMSIDNDIIKDITVKLSDSNNDLLKNFELISCKGSNYQVLTTNK